LAEKPGRTKTKPFPTKEQILEFLREQPVGIGKREIARAFHVTGDNRVLLKQMLKELEDAGKIDRSRQREPRPAGQATLPEMAVLEITKVTDDADYLARPVRWEHEGQPPIVHIARVKPGQEAPDQGDRVLAKVTRTGPRTFDATIIKLLSHLPSRIVGIFEKTAQGGRINPTDRRDKATYLVARDDADGAASGEVVVGELLPSKGFGTPRARIVEKLGKLGDAGSISLIAINTHDIPTEFPAAALAQAKAAQPVPLGDRTDLRPFKLVTIDGADARDFDDAVFAEPDPDPANKGGFHLLVAIADVAHYVRAGDPLDKSAYERGNSVYFPDRVVPMLPEELSNELCSLKPHVDRACMAAHIWIDQHGRKLSHRFVRGLMRSVARLTYERAQAAIDGQPDEETAPLVEPVITPLYGAFKALLKERVKRGTLDLDIPERQVKIDRASGAVTEIVPRARLDSHRLIEEFMVLANVCAAETLEAAHVACMYRIHDQPSDEKLGALREFLGSLELNLAKGQVIKPKNFMQLLTKVADTPYSRLVNEVVLRSQAQAAYSPDNIGHFGLALPRYAHFTSPIRRYADLLVHRGLITAQKLGPDGLPGSQAEHFEATGTHISATERRAAVAEREAIERYTASYLAAKIGGQFEARVSGVTRFGLFVTLTETGADGLLPMRALPNDYYNLDEAHHRLIGERTGRIYRLGDAIEVMLGDVDIATGSLVLGIVGDDGEVAKRPSRKPARPPSGGRNGRMARRR
jgi:ribonuclease R